ncbi:MAG TPA: glutamate ABC transporter substrate-binding protein, partial [Tepidiformaceae bacterium]|nr:glutamate ABC transporter substrate-binding protein [Tepidiformaceae bacterium]
MRRPQFLLLLIAALSTIALVAFACGGDDDSDSPTPTSDPPTSQPVATPTFPAGSSMAEIVKDGKLVVGVKFDQPGFGYKDPVTNKVDGFDVAIARELARSLGLREEQVEFVEAVTRERIPLLEEGKVDVVIATMTITEERKSQIDFSRSYFLAGQSILVKKDNISINGVGDLNGRKVCTAQGSTSAKNLAEKAPRSDPILLDGYSACVAALKDGRVEAVTTDDIILAGFAREDKTLKLVGGQFTKEPYGIGVKKGRED